jgi:protein gp37
LRFKKIFPNGFEPTFYLERLKEPWELKKPSKIFVCSISDLFAPWTPEAWRFEVLRAAEDCPVKHTFQFLTKNPENIPLHIQAPDNFWIGTTVTNEGNDYRNIAKIVHVKAKVCFVSFEPLLDSLPHAISLRGVDWAIIGKLTGSHKIELKTAWVEDVIAECDKEGIPVFMKNNLAPYFEKSELRQEFPEGAKPK